MNIQDENILFTDVSAITCSAKKQILNEPAGLLMFTHTHAHKHTDTQTHTHAVLFIIYCSSGKEEIKKEIDTSLHMCSKG